MAKCKWCEAEIIWIRTPAGALMPCDSDPVAYRRSEKSRKLIVTKNGDVIRAQTGMDVRHAEGLGYEPHWASCRRTKKELREEGDEQIRLQIGADYGTKTDESV